MPSAAVRQSDGRGRRPEYLADNDEMPGAEMTDHAFAPRRDVRARRPATGTGEPHHEAEPRVSPAKANPRPERGRAGR